MAEEDKQPLLSPPESSPHPENPPPETSTQPKFDPSRMIGIIKRKALIKDLASAYHTECLAYCRELLDLQKRTDEPFLDIRGPEDMRKETSISSKRAKKRLG